MQSGTAIFQRTWVFVLACLLALVAAAPVHAATQRDALVLETLTAFKRAGCSGVLTYHAAHAAQLLG